MRAALADALRETGILVIDGSMSTALEAMGCNLNDRLWSAKALVETPDLVRRVHMDYFRAGADCGITDSYQATIPGLLAKGYSEKEAEALITRSVELFIDARDTWWNAEGLGSGRVWPLCLGAVGPYGAYLADGSEYRGNYGVSDDDLKDFHLRRMELLWNAGADLLLIETQPSLHEALLEAEIAESLGADYWISFSCRDGSHIHEGDLIRDCAKTLAVGHPHLKMIGVNCTPPQFVEHLILELKMGCDLPVAVYPNSGEEYDPATKTWHGNRDGITFGDYARRWMRAGASAVGGCCRTVDNHIREVAKARTIYQKIG
ncbi:homocysteine S-methyltransferase [Oscillibacter sp. PC13]|uniref:homocysteine S-methyltransferase n=1 Tax=Oscillibacter sp. PC13 TaxID=1855299 RepID=UPI0008E13489|nr:homocysteine S-methyltransferase [Oscillibacter sp. PC13]SFP04132.1 homocysteine S-methyltransferase [Oscillibacter sp. PC13]